ncbi:MAG: CRISPR-associated endonuclease Cas2 [Pseudomonadota bacterium]|nr:CRISPR-associated endonuclease Cas2 [Pseudomonadota bacterium]
MAYDVTDPRRLRRVARVLEAFGTRVQDSVFECWLDRGSRARLRRLLLGLIDPARDGVRLYPVCGACLPRLRWQGRGEDGGGRNHWVC